MRVYIAGPYTQPDPVANTGRAAAVFNELADMGLHPYCPHLVTHTLTITKSRPYREWMQHCFDWVKASQVVVRIPGPSPGADEETELAGRLGIPVVQWREDGDHIRTLTLLIERVRLTTEIVMRPAWVTHSQPGPLSAATPQNHAEAGRVRKNETTKPPERKIV